LSSFASIASIVITGTGFVHFKSPVIHRLAVHASDSSPALFRGRHLDEAKPFRSAAGLISYNRCGRDLPESRKSLPQIFSSDIVR
jgi:hypothetical protein